ncbi:MAG: hypothetical protein ACKVUS_07335 [Saprospiraceae bacterium]
MRKIDKTIILSTAYKEWEEDLENRDVPHPAYNSSQNKFYTDVVMNLLYCQQGLCAYTEVQLCPAKYLTPEYWENGRYKPKNHLKPNDGSLEHFDEKLKHKPSDPASQQKDWLWSNFFVIHTDRNTQKNTKPIDYILKPDEVGYDPFALFDYSNEEHEFLPKNDGSLDDETRQRIRGMLDTLGINFPNLVDRRRHTINYALGFGLDHLENQFPTAFEFCRRLGTSRSTDNEWF